MCLLLFPLFLSFLFTSPTSTHIYTLSLHDALPISQGGMFFCPVFVFARLKSILAQIHPGHVRRRQHRDQDPRTGRVGDRKSTRLNSSHLGISYAVFCLKKKKK